MSEVCGTNLPAGSKCCVEGTLGRFGCGPGFVLPNASCVISLDLRRLRRVLDLFSVSTFAIGFASVVGASAGVAIALGSSLGELGVFEDECLR
jgi:hypothetical protein